MKQTKKYSEVAMRDPAKLTDISSATHYSAGHNTASIQQHQPRTVESSVETFFGIVYISIKPRDTYIL